MKARRARSRIRSLIKGPVGTSDRLLVTAINFEGVHMKIALITDDGKYTSQHFGRAAYYLVLSVENGQIVSREMRDKLNHSHFVNEHHEQEHGQPHGFSPVEKDRHARMAQPIGDCEAVLCGGMGAGAYQSLQAAGIRPIMTDLLDIDAAAQAYIDGSIVDHVEMLH
jgi:predicted Fe-Mo cluster-binding NifX family protein